MFKTVSNNIDKGLQNPYLMTVVKVFLILYAAQIAPKLPESITSYFSNTWVRMIVLFLISYIVSRDIQLGIVLAFLFVTSTNVLSGKGAFENFANYSKDYVPSSNLKLISPQSEIYPGCFNVTLDDLHTLFDGSSIKMQDIVNKSFKELLVTVSSKNDKDQLTRIGDIIGLPDNIEFNNENAPYIATLLVNNGVSVNGVCRPPQQ
jgi:hypothetical protein